MLISKLLQTAEVQMIYTSVKRKLNTTSLRLYVCKTKVNCTNDFTTTGTEKNWTETTQSFSSIHEEIKMTSTTQVDELS